MRLVSLPELVEIAHHFPVDILHASIGHLLEALPRLDDVYAQHKPDCRVSFSAHDLIGLAALPRWLLYSLSCCTFDFDNRSSQQPLVTKESDGPNPGALIVPVGFGISTIEVLTGSD
jgi:hypothetical protein